MSFLSLMAFLLLVWLVIMLVSKSKKYYSAEIDKYAIQVSTKNYPDIVRLGSVVDITAEKLVLPAGEQFDLLIGGSPCQDLSIAKKDRKGLGAKTGLYKIGERTPIKIGKVDNKKYDIGNRVYLAEGTSCCLNTLQTDYYKIEEQDTIRKLTPLECERLQSLPDGYTDYVSNTQRYKCIGNAFNAEVIAHILQSIPK